MAQRVHISLTANTAASVTITGLDPIEILASNGSVKRSFRPLKRVTVINHDVDNPVFYRTDGEIPTVDGGDDDYVVPAGGAWVQDVLYDEMTFALISEGNSGVSVIGEA